MDQVHKDVVNTCGYVQDWSGRTNTDACARRVRVQIAHISGTLEQSDCQPSLTYQLLNFKARMGVQFV